MDQKRIGIEFLIITAVNVAVSISVFKLNPGLNQYNSAYFGGLAIMFIAVSAMFLVVGNMLGKNSGSGTLVGTEESQQKRAATRAIYICSWLSTGGIFAAEMASDTLKSWGRGSHSNGDSLLDASHREKEQLKCKFSLGSQFELRYVRHSCKRITVS